MNIDMQQVHERMMARLEAMSAEELVVALEECEETDVGRALREGEEFIGQMDYETLVNRGIVKGSDILNDDDWNGF